MQLQLYQPLDQMDDCPQVVSRPTLRLLDYLMPLISVLPWLSVIDLHD